MAVSKNTDPYLILRNNPSPNKDTLFLLEVGGLCPKCGKPLIQTKGSKIHKLYQIAHIYPNSPLPNEIIELDGLERLGENCEDSANKIALCKDCHGYYDDHKTKSEYLWFVQKKKEVMSMLEIRHAGHSYQIENEISLIIDKLTSLTLTDLSKPTYKGIPIASKIPASYMLLKSKVTSYVTSYFNYIQEIFLNLDSSNQLNFNLISSEIHTFFLKCDEQKLDYSKTFESIVNWIKQKTNTSSTEACEAIVSFFIQDCDVFYEITE